ncbi:MAG: hypothetical protein Q8T08_09695 [Ignavibacteria bacterium]|nr:hypothetical protein [Ignavibacteria bacterium]
MKYAQEDSATGLHGLIATIVTFAGSVAVSIYAPGMFEYPVQFISAVFFILFIIISDEDKRESFELFKVLIIMAISIFVAIYHMVMFTVIVCLVFLYIRLSS